VIEATWKKLGLNYQEAGFLLVPGMVDRHPTLCVRVAAACLILSPSCPTPKRVNNQPNTKRVNNKSNTKRVNNLTNN
jgi:hypothetical protein